ncbi:hypothetical protein BME42_20250 [Klebsiella pneumoniae]|uniref:hypothetical protein n=1 Tax=Klebsiella pneumoniae TaxID=573 RepID=UPI000B40F233|nr:hypothetical protein [Klebsiella pneumoniae]OVW95684.1 hypothetical protein BME42_20250 [Klebsiella pneumoniae]
MNIETVNELIQSLESAGELSIREQKFLKLAKAHVQLAAENVAMRETIEAVRGVADNSSGIAGWHLNGEIAQWSEILPEIDAIETPATDRIVAGIKADGAKAAGDYLKLEAQHMPVVERLMMQDAAEICYGTAARLREGADK